MKKILLVDDDNITLTLCKHVLEKDGYVIEITDNATEAIELVTQGNYNLMIFDINMPGISGLDLLQYLRSFGIETPVIFLSGSDVEWTKEESLRIGGARFLSKENDFKQLPLIVKEVLGL